MLKLINYTLSGGKKWGRGFLFMRIKALTTPFAVSYTSKNIVLSGARGNVVDNIVDNIVVTHARMTPLSGLRMDTEPETLGVDGEAPVEASNASPLVQRTRQLLYRRMKVGLLSTLFVVQTFGADVYLRCEKLTLLHLHIGGDHGRAADDRELPLSRQARQPSACQHCRA
jgi:hypothetical protein